MTTTVTDPKTGRRHEFVPRAEWGARQPSYVNALSAFLRFFVHWAVVKASTDLEANKAAVRAIQRFHMDVRGWSDIAYSWLVDHAGRIYEGRGFNRAGGHTRGYNSTSEAVCYIGGPGDKPSKAALDAMAAIKNIEAAAHHNPSVQTGPHNSVDTTACPGPDLTPWASSGMPPQAQPPLPPPPPPEPPRGINWRFSAYRKPTVLDTRYASVRRRDVAEVQYILNLILTQDQSRWLRVDGLYGARTANAVRQFQDVFSFFIRPISRDGKFGPQTSDALAEVLTMKGIW